MNHFTMPEPKPATKLPKPETANDALRRATPVPAAFYSRDPRVVARELLGKILVRREGKRLRAGRIVEVEAYLGVDDAAAHAAAGKTKRNDVIFGPPGRAYVYFIYGFHYCLNISCEPDGHAGCVLIRALEPLVGIEEMFAARDLEPEHRRITELKKLTSGPGRLAEALSITRERDNGKDVASRKSDLQVVDDGYAPEKIATTVRIGIQKSASALLRYVIEENAFVSGRRLVSRGERGPKENAKNLKQ
jgi:DNA-3-methyladenine glycosylase